MSKTLVFWIEPPLTYPPWAGIGVYTPHKTHDFDVAIQQLDENPTVWTTVMVSNLKNMYSWWGKGTTATLIEKLVAVCSRHNLKLIVAPDLDYAKYYMAQKQEEIKHE